MSVDSEAELGTLIVVVLKARNLNDKHSFYKQDVFAQIALDGTTHRTPVDVKGGQHPVWDAEIRLPIMKNAKDKSRTLEVSCWSKEHKKDDLLGEGKVDISETLKIGEFDDWVPLTINDVHRGDLYLEMTFYAHGPPKPSLAVPASTVLNRRASKFSPSERLQRLAPKTPPKVSPISSPLHSPNPSRLSPFDPSTSQTKDRLTGSPSPPHSRLSSSSSSSRRQDSPLPPLPSVAPPAIPETLMPGSGIRKQTLTARSTSSTPSPPRQEYFPVPIPGNSLNVYNIPHPSNQAAHPTIPPRPSQHSYTLPAANQPPSPYLQHAMPPVGHSVTLPNVHSNVNPTLPAVPYQLPGAWPDAPKSDIQATTISFPVPQQSSAGSYGFNLSYSTPLPVPTQSGPPPYSVRQVSDPYAGATAAPLFPLPLPGSSPPRGHQALDPQQEARRQALLRVEEEAARRKQQEDRDLALARQLDRELNSE